MARPDGFTQILEFRPGMRRLIEDAIESLILLLDEIDGDDGIEEDDIEQDDPPEPDFCDCPADLGPPFTMDQSIQGQKIEASPPEAFPGRVPPWRAGPR